MAGRTLGSNRPSVTSQAAIASSSSSNVSGLTTTASSPDWFSRVTSLSGRKRLQRPSSCASRSSARVASSTGSLPTTTTWAWDPIDRKWCSAISSTAVLALVIIHFLG